MFGPLGFSELIFIFALALLIFGPRELPKIGRTIGKAMAEFRKASNELRRTLNTELLEEELRQSDPRKVLSDAASDLRTSVEKAGTEEANSSPGSSKAVGIPSSQPETAQTGTAEAETEKAETAQIPADDASEAPAGAPVVRAPAGRMARGDLSSTEDKPPSGEVENSADVTEQPANATEQSTDSQEKK